MRFSISFSRFWIRRLSPLKIHYCFVKIHIWDISGYLREPKYFLQKRLIKPEFLMLEGWYNKCMMI